MTTLCQSSILNGTPLLGITYLAIRIEPVSSPISGTSALPSGCELSRLRWIGIFGSRIFISYSTITGSTTAEAIVEWLSTCCSRPGLSTISR